MNEQIKKRISAINIGIIPDGYKKTKVGIVPAEWEIKTLAELCEISAGGDIEKEHCQTTPNEKFKFPVYSNALTNKGLYGYSDIFKISEKTVTVTGRGEIGYAIARNEKYYPIVRLLVLKPKNENINTVFLAHQINESKIYIESTGVPQLTAPQLSLLKIFCPSLKEQIIIAEILSTQDKLIELYERKIEQLKTLKKGYLQKMFPKKGCKYPELRFKGFTDPWEQRKLGAVLSLLKDGTHGTHKNSDEGVFLLSAKNIKNGEVYIDENADRRISKQEFDSIHSNFRLQENDVLLTIVGSIGEVSILKNPDIMTFQRSVAFLRPKDGLLSTFLKTEIESYDFQKELSDRKSQSAQPGVYLGELEKIPFNLPNVEEQQQIGSYFSNLDRLITLHQHKLDKEKQKKKALMQLLLTGKVRVST